MNRNTKRCSLCSSSPVENIIDFGLQPLCNRFLPSLDAEESVFPLALGVCSTCGIVQLLDVLPADELRPRVDWLTYNEPEGHLDDLASQIAHLPGLSPSSKLWGVSFKDDSTLARLQKLGYHDTRRFEPAGDLDIADRRAGIETIQERLTPTRAEGLVRKYGAADVVIARHVWEHAANPIAFALALKRMVKSDGYVVFEVPDCEKAFAACDYTTVWEEHPLYFTSHTFHSALKAVGFSLVRFFSIPYVLENSLIAIVRPSADVSPVTHNAGSVLEEHDRIRGFASHFHVRKARVRDCLQSHYNQQRRIAIFGAGHLACMFVNLFEIQDLVDCVVDDNPHKIGLHMPGSRLPIAPSRALLDRKISLCLLSINAGGIQPVIDKHRAFLDRGGSFRSIFPASDIAIDA